MSDIELLRCGGTNIEPHRIVFMSAAMQIVTAFETSRSIGVSTEVGGSAGQPMNVVLGGTAHLQINDPNLYPGAFLGCNASGKGIALVPGNRAIGILLETPTVAGQVCKILVVQSS